MSKQSVEGSLRYDNPLFVLTHHDFNNSKAVSATIYNCFRGNSVFLSSNQIGSAFKIYANRKKNPRVVVNGYTSMLKIPTLLILFILPKSVPVALYWHETAWALREIRGNHFLGFARDLFLKKAVGARQNLTNWCASPIGPQVLAARYSSSLQRFQYVGNGLFENLPKLSGPQRRYPNSRTFSVIAAGLPNTRKGFDKFKLLASLLENEIRDGSVKMSWFVPPGARMAANSNLDNFVMDSSSDFMNEVKKHDLLIVMSRDDPNPVVAIEALASGVPVACLPGSGTPFLSSSVLLVDDEYEMAQLVRDQKCGNRPVHSRTDLRKVAEFFTVNSFLKRAKFTVSDKQKKKVKIVKMRSRIYGIQFRIKLAVIEILLRLLIAFGVEIDNHSVVVASSPKIIGRKLGKTIDSHSEIIRMSSFGSRENVKDTGQKTTIFYFTPALNQKIPNSSKRVRRVCLLKGPFRTEQLAKNRISKGPNLHLKDFYFAKRPILVRMFVFILYPRQQKNWPSTGTEALLRTIFPNSNKVNRTAIVGFDLARLANSNIVNHFYGVTTKQDGKHDFLLESNFLEILVKLGVAKEL